MVRPCIADFRRMNHVTPPDNLPFVDCPPALALEPESPGRIVHFRKRRSVGKVDTALPPADAVGPATRSLQPITTTMTQHHDLALTGEFCEVADIARLLCVSRAAVYRWVATKALAAYRLPGGLRFRADDVTAFIERYRTVTNTPYARQEAQG